MYGTPGFAVPTPRAVPDIDLGELGLGGPRGGSPSPAGEGPRVLH
jgi:hypothetical protein